VVMIIVLFIAAIFAIVFGLWLKRRNKRKQERNTNRDTILAAEDATNHLKDKHPDVSSSMSQIQIPNLDGSVVMSGANSKAAPGVDDATGGKGKGRADPTVRETDHGDAGPSSPDEERHVGFAQSLSTRIKKKGSKSSRRNIW
jgi:type II secretory pathway pseudopilin PulG